MRGRPRLVEEGKPIYGPGSEASTDHVMDDEHHDDHTVAEAITSTSHHLHPHPSPSSGTGMTSLQRAAHSYGGGGRKYTKPRPKTGGSSSYVIGGGGGGEQATRGGASRFSVASSYYPHPTPTAMHHAHHVVEEHSFTIPSQHPPAQIQPQHANAASWSQPTTEYQHPPAAGYHHQHQHQHQHQQHTRQQPQNQYSPAQSMNHHAMDHDHGMNGDHHTVYHNQQYATTPSAAPHPHQHHQKSYACPAGSYHSTPITHHTHQTTSFTIGGGNVDLNRDSNYAEDYSLEKIERMEGVEDQGIKPPLVVLDGANVAYAYATAVVGLEHVSSSLAAHAHNNKKPEPDARGIQVAIRYFRQAGVRLLVVLPTSWFRSKPRPKDSNRNSSMMETPQLEILHDLKAQGLLVAAPPTDDDDAYALLIARREQARAQGRNHGQGPGFVLSNDMFRDAAARDLTGELKQWLTTGSGSDNNAHGPGRISFAFCDMGTMDDHGDRVLDFIPNPRHPLVAWVESEHRRVNSI